MSRRSLKSLLVFGVIFCFGIWCGISLRASYFSNNSYERFSSAESPATCNPQTNIMFLKTHKTGGTTIQNIILRHAKKRGLFVGLPLGKDFRFRYDQGYRFHKQFMRSAPKGINILCHHMRFDKEQVASVMPKNTKYFTILREPGDLFASFFDYFHLNCKSFAKVPQTTVGLQMWLDDAESFIPRKGKNNLWWFQKNGLAFDLGFDNMNEDDDYIKTVIVEMENTFELVLIKDYFEESVILMKDFLCLSLSDIQHLRMNSRISSSIKVDDAMRKKIRKWNKIDSALFDHFNKTFWKKVEAYGHDKMNYHLEQLRQMNDDLADKCIEGQGVVKSELVKDERFRVFKPKGVQTGGFNLKQGAVNDTFCQDVAQIEKVWHSYLLEKQYPNEDYAAG